MAGGRVCSPKEKARREAGPFRSYRLLRSGRRARSGRSRIRARRRGKRGRRGRIRRRCGYGRSRIGLGRRAAGRRHITVASIVEEEGQKTECNDETADEV